MNLRTAKAICKQFNARCYVDGTIGADGKIRWQYSFWGIPQESISELMLKFGLHKAEKLFRSGDVDLKFNNAVFNKVRKCKIVGYTTNTIPEHTIRKIIYECNGKRIR